jgi:hypothetical protein
VIELFNKVLERGLAGDRFVDGVLTPITSRVEIQSIEEAAATTALKGFDGAHEHLQAALRLLGKKPDPDYRNSIKESISVVESVARVISPGKGLTETLKRLSDEARVHRAMAQGFDKLYGYTSGEDGIRHAILNEADVGFI